MKVAIIEDDMDQARLLALWLKPYGFEATLFISAEFFLETPSNLVEFDLLLVDWLLPGMDGLSLVKKINTFHNHPPIIFVTDKDKIDELAAALHSGADDFISKPINKTILLARITATLRRFGHATHTKHLKQNELWIDKQTGLLHFHDQVCHLSTTEMQIMSLFLNMVNIPISRDQLYEVIQVDIPSSPGCRTIDLKISRLRKKLSLFSLSPGEILSQYGQGYVFKRNSE